MGPAWMPDLVCNILKIVNLANTDAIMTKLIAIVYTHKVFNLEKD